MLSEHTTERKMMMAEIELDDEGQPVGTFAEGVICMDWQPIEKYTDRRWPPVYVLLFRPTAPHRLQVAEGYWETQPFHKKPRPYWGCARRISLVNECRDHEPTHFMPIPSPPRGAEMGDDNILETNAYRMPETTIHRQEDPVRAWTVKAFGVTVRTFKDEDYGNTEKTLAAAQEWAAGPQTAIVEKRNG